MSEKIDLSPELIDRIIRETACNPKLPKEKINEKANIPPRGSRENRLLIPWIWDNTPLVFGEKIECQPVTLHSKRGAVIKPDLVGKDTHDRPVIVEVKFKFEFQGDSKYLRRDREDRSIGQILHYDRAYKRMCQCNGIPIEVPRLFIVSIDFSKDVADVCKFLRSKCINIEHIAIQNILSK